MQRRILRMLAVVVTVAPAIALAQSPKSATYITDEEVKKVNSQPGIDRTIRVVDIGSEHFAVGVDDRLPEHFGRRHLVAIGNRQTESAGMRRRGDLLFMS